MNIPNLNKKVKIVVKTKTKAILGITVALVAVLFAAYFALTCPRVLVSFTVSFTIGAMLGVKNLKSHFSTNT